MSGVFGKSVFEMTVIELLQHLRETRMTAEMYDCGGGAMVNYRDQDLNDLVDSEELEVLP